MVRTSNRWLGFCTTALAQTQPARHRYSHPAKKKMPAAVVQTKTMVGMFRFVSEMK